MEAQIPPGPVRQQLARQCWQAQGLLMEPSEYPGLSMMNGPHCQVIYLNYGTEAIIV